MTLTDLNKIYKKEPLYNKLIPPGSWRRMIMNYFMIPLASLFVFYLLMDNIVMPLITRHGTEFELPEITGYQLQDAEHVLDLVGLGIEVTSEEYHADKDEGTVLSQYPQAGTKVKSGRIIKVVTSIGQKSVKVPQLAGFSVRQAKLNIEGSGLVLGDIAWTFSDSLPERVVVFSYPASGTEIPYGSPVNLMVNRGRLSGIVFMPKLVGRSLDEARSLLDAAELKIGLIKYIRDENYLPETVLEQSVEEAVELEVGEEIDLIVSTTE
ncbi:MAG TPA: PASTA domain-containing protein [candidate division Zixibacteria bacterium]|nr:PASTA domain-containing protein [candidate division Zixibacteria bacterium]